MPLPPREVGKVASVANLTASGAIGTASVDTDVRVIMIAQTTAGLTLTLPSPNDASVVAGLDVLNTGTASFTMYGVVVAAGSLVRCAWTGSAWVAEALAASSASIAPSYTVASLPTTGVTAGQMAWASNGRAITGVGTLGAGFTTQASGAGTGCLVTWSSSAAKWQIAGTTTTVAA